jgi:ADP-ribose pyrophosphatase YjhB (NUDIX family)
VKSGKGHKLIEARRYRYCPWCASPLESRDFDGRQRLSCPSCNFIWYRNPIPAAGAILERDRRVLLVKRKFPPRIGYWCFPAGFMEYNESPVECCRREVQEETGLQIKIGRLFWNYAGHDDPRSNAVLAMYLAEIVGGELAPGDDAAEVRFFDLDKIPSNIAFQAHRDAIVDYRRFVESGLFPGEM